MARTVSSGIFDRPSRAGETGYGAAMRLVSEESLWLLESPRRIPIWRLSEARRVTGAEDGGSGR